MLMGVFFNSNIFKSNCGFDCSGKRGDTPKMSAKLGMVPSMGETQQSFADYYDYLKNDYLDILKNLQIKLYELSNIGMKRLSKHAKKRETKVMEKGLQVLQIEANMLRTRLGFFKKNIDDIYKNWDEKQKILLNVKKIQDYIDTKKQAANAIATSSSNSSSSSSSSSDSSSSADERAKKIKPKQPVKIGRKSKIPVKKVVPNADDSSSEGNTSDSSVVQHMKDLDTDSDFSMQSSDDERKVVVPAKTKMSPKKIESTASSPSDKDDHKSRISTLREQVYADLEKLDETRKIFHQHHVHHYQENLSVSGVKKDVPSGKKVVSAVKVVNYNLPEKGDKGSRNIDVKAFIKPRK